MTNFDLEREVMNMLNDKSEDMPRAMESDPAVLRKSRARRRTKLAGLGAGSLAAALAVVGIAVTLNDDGNRDIKVQPAETTNAAQTTDAPVTTAPQGTDTTAPVTSWLEPGAIVAARPNGTVVELEADGSVVRELYAAGAQVGEIDVVPSGDAIYVRIGDDFGCGEVRRVDLETGTAEVVGEARGVAISGDAKVLALGIEPTTNDPLACTGNGMSGSVLVRHLESGYETLFPYEGTYEGNPAPEYAARLALSYDGSRLAFERCWESCSLALADVPLSCIDGTATCDYSPPKWNDMTQVATDGGGYSPVFQGEVLIAARCECAVEGPQAWRLASFDPETGARLQDIQTLPETTADVAAEGAAVVVRTYDNTVLVWTMADPSVIEEPLTAAGTYTAVAIAPVAEE